MTEPRTHPTRLLKFLAGFARWALWLLLALWLMLALAWGALHGWIVPRIGDFRLQVQAQAESAIGVPVRIGALTARSEGVFPTIALHDMAVLDPEGRPALQLPYVEVVVSPQSLLRLGFDRLSIRDPQLEVRRERDGRILVAGLPLGGGGASDDLRAADWLFSQREIHIDGGQLRWVDEQRGVAPLQLEQVRVVVRNRGWKHGISLEATPPAAWGERFTLQGDFRERIFSRHSGDWKQWSGQLYAAMPKVDVTQLRRYVDTGDAEVTAGAGALRAWVDLRRGELVGGVVDMALTSVRATLGAALPPLSMRTVAGRLGLQQLDGGFEFTANNLAFETDDGLQWPSTQLRWYQQDGRGPRGEGAMGELTADHVNLAVLAQIASRLPLAPELHARLTPLAPQGHAQGVRVQWRGPLRAPTQYQAKGDITGLSLAMTEQATTPGLSGAAVHFDMTQSGGTATVAIANGALAFPDIFEEPKIPVQQLSASVRWQMDGDNVQVQANDLRFANADAAGHARLSWKTADPQKSSARARFPGVLDLSGQLTRADGTRVHRYLPLVIPAPTRHYVRDAITKGVASVVDFRVKGDLHDVPFGHGQSGDFYIGARVNDATYAYVPPALQHKDELPWPVLAGLSGLLVFERDSMRVENARSSFVGFPGLKASGIQAKIQHLDHPEVEVNADVRGGLSDMLGLVRSSHITQLTSHALDQVSATGPSQLKLQLQLPIANLPQSKVQGSVVLAGNDVQFTPDVPLVSQAQGTVQFSETGFSLANVQGQALGGEVKLEGGMRVPTVPSPTGDSGVQVRASGTATADGLKSLTPLAPLLRYAKGSTSYAVQVGVRRGVAELRVTTPLQGLSLDLPAPLGKPLETSVPVRYETQITPESANASSESGPLHELLTVDVGGVGTVNYLLELVPNAPARVLRGAIAVGQPAGEPLSMPERGVVARVTLPTLDVGQWQDTLKAAPAPVVPPAPQSAVQGAVQAAASATSPAALAAYLPTSGRVRADAVHWQGRSLHQVNAEVASLGNNAWRTQLTSTEAQGTVEYRPAASQDSGPGLIYARFGRLALPQAQEQKVEELLAEQPGTLPALDIVVEDFQLHGRPLGTLEVDARNQLLDDGRREWRLSKFNVLMPEARFTSSGDWSQVRGQTSPSERRTAVKFKVEIEDSGALLARFGMADVIRRGKGRMTGEVAWRGAPLAPDYRSLTGLVHVEMESGQFLKADPGLAKLLSVLSLQSLPRRFTLDFRDVFSDGFAFDFVRGDVRIDRGVAQTNNLQMKGVNAAVLMEGKADIERETQDLHVVVVPEINAMTASLVATAINPVIGLGSFLAQVFLRGPLIQAATQEFRIDGTWESPRVERVRRKKDDPPGTRSAELPSAPSGETP